MMKYRTVKLPIEKLKVLHIQQFAVVCIQNRSFYFRLLHKVMTKSSLIETILAKLNILLSLLSTVRGNYLYTTHFNLIFNYLMAWKLVPSCLLCRQNSIINLAHFHSMSFWVAILCTVSANIRSNSEWFPFFLIPYTYFLLSKLMFLNYFITIIENCVF